MTDLASIITDYLQQNRIASNPGSSEVKQEVTAQSLEMSSGNLGNLGNPEKLDTRAMRKRLTNAANVSGLLVDQLWSFLDESDIDDLQQGLISQQELDAYAQLWTRYSEAVPVSNTSPLPAIAETKKVKCRECQHFLPDRIGDGTGIGKCNIDAPASKTGLIWLNTECRCNAFHQIKP